MVRIKWNLRRGEMENTTDLEVSEVRDDLDKESEQKEKDGSETSSSVADKAPIGVETKVVERKPERPLADQTVSRYLNVGGNFYTGVDVTSEDAIRKREERAKRFGIQIDPPPQQDKPEVELIEKFKARSKRFGTELLLADGQPVKLVKSLPPIPEGEIRPEAVHLHGLDEMSTEDVFEFFSLYSPRNIEWINDKSCNVVWDDRMSARRALIGLGYRPVGVKREIEDANTISEREEGVEERGEDGREQEGEETCHIQWWLAPQHPRCEQLLVRQATTGDKKKRGSARESQYYRKYGNPNRPLEMDLRGRLGRKRPVEGNQGEVEEEMEVDDASLDPLSSLVKRPKPMHADRDDEDDTDEDTRGEKEVGGVGLMRSDSDLRKRLKKKRKWRDLHLRLGSYPRLVEENT